MRKVTRSPALRQPWPSHMMQGLADSQHESVKTTLKRLAYPYALYLELSYPDWHFVLLTVIADPHDRDV